ncbi:hypothetical protein [Paenibacillus sabinae]|uniref:Uncharacterized protein n=1 Tax=Paenibacillus sabinae T27 TaxID=1268072 RepID=X4ZUT6_9BACL|nr:hypothetical protein [Paenibacillus sabinae]AHV95564.1 hypothetical protein PSAB_03140 [Paenibacillus sabinae T27]
MTKKYSIVTAAMASVLTLLLTLPEPASVLGAGSSSEKAAAPAALTPGTSHAEAVYKASLPLLLSPSKLPEAISYLNANMYAVGSYRATIMTLSLENAQKAALSAWEDKFYNSIVQRKLTDMYEPGDSLAQLADKTKNANLRLMLRRAAACGYKLETAEGSFFPVIDYEAYRKYKPYVTDDIRDYISIMAVESNFPSNKDNGLVIAWAEVASRALAQEAFIADYPRSNRIGIVKQLYKMYETDTFYGLNNTPLFHYDNLEMDLEAQKAYGAILAKSTGKSAYLEKLDGFMKLAKEHDFKLTDEIELYRRQAAPSQE